MSITLPKIEALITVPSSSWGGKVDAGADAYLSAQDTYLSSTAVGGTNSLLAAFAAHLSSFVGSTTVAMSSTTGKVTITWGSGSHAYTWASTTLRNLLGFTGNLSSAAAHTGTQQAKALWLPNTAASGQLCAISSVGKRVSDRLVTVARSGETWTSGYGERQEQRLVFQFLTLAKTWEEDEATANESAESLWADYLGPTGENGGEFRYYTSAASDTSYLTTASARRDYVHRLAEFAPTRSRENNDSHWTWELGPLVAT